LDTKPKGPTLRSADTFQTNKIKPTVEKVVYKSRNNIKFDDTDSFYVSSDEGDNDDGLAKTSITYLKK
jgi:hypothetical protein